MARATHKQKSLPTAEQPIFYKAAIYARLSVEDNGKGSDSLESQIEFLEGFIASQPDLEKAAVYSDNGFTGTNFQRPAFDQMLNAVRRGEINCVVVKDLSRLGRNYVETGEFLEKVCPFLGLRFIAVNDSYDSEKTTGNSQLSASLSNIINDLYAKDVSRKVSSALKTKMTKGDYIGKWEKYGYLKDPENKNHLIVNPETAPVVQIIYTWRSEGMSYMGINRRLNEMKIPSPGQYKADRGIVTNNNQKPNRILWNRHVITDILSDPVYLGHLVQHRSGQSLYAGIPFSRMDEREWIIAENTHEPIISEALFYRVQDINRAALKTARENHGKYDDLPKAENIYKGKLVCADCGAQMKLHRSFSKKRDRVYFTFNCPVYAEHGKMGCTGKSKRKADLDDAVLYAIRAQMDVFLDSAAVLRALLEQKQSAKIDNSAKQRRKSLDNQSRRLRECVSELYKDMKDGLLTNDEYSAQRQRYQSRITELETQQAELEQTIEEAERTLSIGKRWADIVIEYSEATELSEAMLNACVERIRVHSDGSIEIKFNYMEEFTLLHEAIQRLREEVA